MPNDDNEYPFGKKLTDLRRWEGDAIFIDEDGKYGFWEETWTEVYGPFNTLEEAEQSLEEYCKKYLS
jgi:hypothetical protein